MVSGKVYQDKKIVDIQKIWHSLFSKKKFKKILEIGSFEGRSAIFIAENFGNLDTGFELFCIDTWTGSEEHSKYDFEIIEKRFDSNIEILKKKLGKKIKISKKKMNSTFALCNLISEGMQSTFEFIYIDGSHNASDVMTDAVLAFQLLKEDGYLIFDDYLWDYGYMMNNNILAIPKVGIDNFVNTFYDKIKPIASHESYQFYCTKIKK